MELAVAIHDGTAVVIASQDPTRTAAAESADRAAFRTFLAGTPVWLSPLKPVDQVAAQGDGSGFGEGEAGQRAGGAQQVVADGGADQPGRAGGERALAYL